MSLPWLRLYTEFSTDPKIQILAFEDQRHYVVLLCLKGAGTLDACSVSETYRERMIAKALGLDPATAIEVKRRLIEGGLITDDWHPSAWNQRQMKSDHDSADRKKNQRIRDKERESHNDVTTSNSDSHALEGERDSDAEVDKTISPMASESEISQSMNEIRAKYPKASGREDWITAEKGARTLVLNGHASWAELISGVRRYRQNIDVTGSYAMNPSKFFTAVDRPWSQAWVIPENKSQSATTRKTKFSQAMEALDRA